MSKILYLTESTFDFSQVDPNSILVTEYKKDLPSGVYHTSLGDLTVDKIIKLSSQFDEVRLEKQGFDLDGGVFKETLSLFQYLCRENSMHEYGEQKFIDHPDVDKRLDGPMLWVFGCSHSHGVGLKDHELTYGAWLSQWLDLPLNQITKPGSSLSWSHRHLFNSRIQKQDTVIWQLTTPGRLSRYNGKHVEEIVLTSTKDRKLLDSISDTQLYFNQINLLNTGVSFLRLLGCQFVITSITNISKHYDYVSEYTKYPEYCSNYGLHLDSGTDGVHAGPLSHKAIAQRILNHIQS